MTHPGAGSSRVNSAKRAGRSRVEPLARPRLPLTTCLADHHRRVARGPCAPPCTWPSASSAWLDPEGFRIVQEAIRALAQRADGAKRSRPKVVATVARTVSDSQFDALALRDHGCRILGCPIPPDACDAHHSIHWTDHGNTDLDDLVLACWHHHHWLHEQRWSIQPLGAGHFILVDPDGTTRPLEPPLIGLALPPAEPATLPFEPLGSLTTASSGQD